MGTTYAKHNPDRIKTVTPGRARVVHVETELGIVNVYVGLTDNAGRRVERVEMIPNTYAGEPQVIVDGARFIEQTNSPPHPPGAKLRAEEG